MCLNRSCRKSRYHFYSFNHQHQQYRGCRESSSRHPKMVSVVHLQRQVIQRFIAPPVTLNLILCHSRRQVTLDLVKRAELCGFKALVLTVDAPVFGIRHQDARNKFRLPPHLTMANFRGAKATKINESQDGSSLNAYVNSLFDQSLTWEDIGWLKRYHPAEDNR